MKKGILLFSNILLISGVLIALFLIRLFSAVQLDDVSPGITCEKKLLEKADVLYVIPKFNGQSIAENQTFCDEILSLGKKIEMHGVEHTYNEFLEDRNESYLEEGILIFQQCFNQTPSVFKPPQLEISENNKKLISKRMKLDTIPTQLFHKIYHCGDTGKFPNWFMDWF